MILTYFDESKPTTDQPYYWYCGLAVRDDLLSELQTEAEALAKECFPHAQPLSRESEFHATDVASGNGNFMGWSLDDRFEILRRLATIIDKPDGVFRIMSQGDTREVRAVDVAREGFMYFVERVSQLGRQKRCSPVLLIGDFESEKTVNRFTRDLSGYRANGTPYAYGRTSITSLTRCISLTRIEADSCNLPTF